MPRSCGSAQVAALLHVRGGVEAPFAPRVGGSAERGGPTGGVAMRGVPVEAKGDAVLAVPFEGSVRAATCTRCCYAQWT